ncbi:MAG TPA: DUF2846 domain-containing protein [Rhizomicrobium sp.]|nr:DUF2846 domain-containing protein [Rhizomicrobium sp.]
MRFRFVAASLSLSMLTGCASGPVFTDAPAPEAGKALLYIYRQPNFVAAAARASFYIDGQNVVDLAAGGYSYVYLAPGRHDLEQRWASYSDVVTIPVDVREGETHYARFQSGFGDQGCAGCVSMKWEIRQVPPVTGRAEIAEEKLTLPKIGTIGSASIPAEAPGAVGRAQGH